MTRRQTVAFLLFLMLALFATVRQGLLEPVFSTAARDRELADLAAKREAYEALGRDRDAVQARLDEAARRLAAYGAAYLPDPADPYAWAVRQVSRLGDEAGVSIERVEEREAPPLRVRRGDAPRLFEPYRCRVEFSGALDDVVALVRSAESRNPLLVVSELYVGPARRDEAVRSGHALFDWPAWAEAAQGAGMPPAPTP